MSFVFPENEERLLAKCLLGERLAQKELYDKYKDAMFTICYRITTDWDEASDALQDAFIQVFRDLKQFHRTSTIGAWIKTIVVRTATKKVKSLNITESLDMVKNDEAIEWPSKLNIEYLEKAINELPNGCRVVFLLNEVEGYSHKEIGNMLNISDGTSKYHLHHAKKVLQKKLKDLV